MELPRDLLNVFDQNADNDMNNEIQAVEVSDGNEELVGNWSKGHRSWWRFAAALEICGSLNVREMI